MPGLKTEQRRRVLDHARRMPGLRLRTEILDAEGGQSLAEALPLSSSVPCALNLAFPFRPLGFDGGGEDSDSLDTSGEYALAEPGKTRFERPYELSLIHI